MQMRRSKSGSICFGFQQDGHLPLHPISEIIPMIFGFKFNSAEKSINEKFDNRWRALSSPFSDLGLHQIAMDQKRKL
jgi:hypothetical protein